MNQKSRPRANFPRKTFKENWGKCHVKYAKRLKRNNLEKEIEVGQRKTRGYSNTTLI